MRVRCVRRAALLSPDNKASVHIISIRFVFKRLLLCQTQAVAKKLRPPQIQSALREMKWEAGYSLLAKSTRPGSGAGEGGKGDLTMKPEIYCDLNS